MYSREVKDTRDSIQSVYHETSSRTASAWYIFPLASRSPLGDCAGRNDHVDGNAIKVKGPEEFLGKVSQDVSV